MSYRTEKSKVEYLFNSVIGLPWEKQALTQCYENHPPWNFQLLYIALDAAWSQDQQQAGNKIQRAKPATNVSWEAQDMYGGPIQKASSASEYQKRNKNFKRDYLNLGASTKTSQDM